MSLELKSRRHHTAGWKSASWRYWQYIINNKHNIPCLRFIFFFIRSFIHIFSLQITLFNFHYRHIIYLYLGNIIERGCLSALHFPTFSLHFYLNWIFHFVSSLLVRLRLPTTCMPIATNILWVLEMGGLCGILVASYRLPNDYAKCKYQSNYRIDILMP